MDSEGSDPFTTELTEFCSSCMDETPHVVTLRILNDGSDASSRQPYRISGCARCGETTKRRAMNL